MGIPVLFGECVTGQPKIGKEMHVNIYILSLL